jgi:MFS family permease
MGTKVILLAALLLFSVGSIIASVTKDVSTLILGRALQGIGGGGLVAGTYILFAHMFQSRERGRYMAIFSVQWAVGTVVGPVIGGAFVEKTTWRVCSPSCYPHGKALTLSS